MLIREVDKRTVSKTRLLERRRSAREEVSFFVLEYMHFDFEKEEMFLHAAIEDQF